MEWGLVRAWIGLISTLLPIGHFQDGNPKKDTRIQATSRAGEEAMDCLQP